MTPTAPNLPGNGCGMLVLMTCLSWFLIIGLVGYVRQCRREAREMEFRRTVYTQLKHA